MAGKKIKVTKKRSKATKAAKVSEERAKLREEAAMKRKQMLSDEKALARKLRELDRSGQLFADHRPLEEEDEQLQVTNFAYQEPSLDMNWDLVSKTCHDHWQPSTLDLFPSLSSLPSMSQDQGDLGQSDTPS